MTVTTGNEMQIEIESDQQWMCHNLSKVTVGTQDAAGMWHCSDGHFRDAKGRTAVEGYQAGDFMNFMGGPLGATLKKLCEYAPINPATGEPYFSIPADGWGTGWSVGPVTQIVIDQVSNTVFDDISEKERAAIAKGDLLKSIHVTENKDGTKRVYFKDENSRIVPGSVKFNGHPVPDEAVNFESGEIDFTKFEEGRKHLAQQMVGFFKGAITMEPGLELLVEEQASGYSTPRLAEKYPAYYKSVGDVTHIDVYAVLRMFNVTDPCVAHSVKKLLLTGVRTGGKSFYKDICEARDTLDRAVEIIEAEGVQE